MLFTFLKDQIINSGITNCVNLQKPVANIGYEQIAGLVEKVYLRYQVTNN